MRIYIENLETEIEGDPSQSVLDILVENDIEISSSCGGMGSCGTCRVLVHEGLNNLAPRNNEESERANDLEFADHERLSCQIQPCDGLKIQIP